MRAEIKKIDATKREILIELEKDSLEKEWDRVYKEISQEVKIPGFRPGKAPREILEKNYKDLAKKKLAESLIPKLYEEVIKKENLKPLSLPEFKDLKIEDDYLKFSAFVEVKPQISIKDYYGISLKFEDIEVKDSEIEAALKNLREYFKKEQTLELPQDAEERALCKNFYCKNIEELKEWIKAQIYLQKYESRKRRIQSQIEEKLLKENKVEVPKKALEAHHQRLVEEAISNLRFQGVPEEEIEKRKKDIKEKLKPVAEKQLKIYFLLETIAEKEGIKIDESEDLIEKVLSFLVSKSKSE